MIKLLQKESRKLFRAFLHPTFFYLLLVGNLILVMATVVVYAIEKDVNPHMKSYFDSLWWGVTTITTVGFGDTVPITFWGRVIGIALMYTGTVFFISFTGMLVTHWVREEMEREIDPLEHKVEEEEKETVRIERLLREIRDRLDRMEKRD